MRTTIPTARCLLHTGDSHSSSLQLMCIQQSGLAKPSTESLAVLPSPTRHGKEKALTELGTTLATLQAQAHPLKDS